MSRKPEEDEINENEEDFIITYIDQINEIENEEPSHAENANAGNDGDDNNNRDIVVDEK